MIKPAPCPQAFVLPAIRVVLRGGGRGREPHHGSRSRSLESPRARLSLRTASTSLGAALNAVSGKLGPKREALPTALGVRGRGSEKTPPMEIAPERETERLPRGCGDSPLLRSREASGSEGWHLGSNNPAFPSSSQTGRARRLTSRPADKPGL